MLLVGPKTPPEQLKAQLRVMRDAGLITQADIDQAGDQPMAMVTLLVRAAALANGLDSVRN